MNLVQLALALEDFTRQLPVIQFAEGQCVRTKNTQATCDRCVTACPTGAIAFAGDVVSLNVDDCVRCGVCMHICPVGAFDRSDGLHKLLQCAENLPDHNTLDIGCALNDSLEKADRTSDGVIQTDNCLAELGPSAYVGLAAVGVNHLRVRLDACADCSLRVLLPEVERGISNAQRIFKSLNSPAQIEIVREQGERWRRRPLYHSQQPPVSRRGFFSMLAPEATSVAKVIAVEPPGSDGDQSILRERQRLLRGLRILAHQDGRDAVAGRLDTDGFVQFAISEDCTACGMCERVCPTGAFKVHKHDMTMQIYFSPAWCTDCDLCVNYCDPKAIQTMGNPEVDDVLLNRLLLLYDTELRECSRCNAQFATNDDELLCPICRTRRENPFGSHVPEAVLAKLPESVRKQLEKYQGTPKPSEIDDPGDGLEQLGP